MGLLVCLLFWEATCPDMLIPLISAVLLLHLLLANTIIVFVTGRPIHPLRSVVLTAGGYLNLGLAFGVFWVRYNDSPLARFRVATAVYQSFRTLTTMGPQPELVQRATDWKEQVLVVSELLAGIYFLTLLLATYASWASRGPR
jgi:hypothetical protein